MRVSLPKPWSGMWVMSMFNTIPVWAMAKTRLLSTSCAWQRNIPGKRMDIKRAITEGNFVVLPCLQLCLGIETARMDIFPFDDGGKTVEYWDVLQVIPETSA